MQNTHLEVHIIGPHSSHTFNANWLEIESPNGNFIIAPDHYPLVSLLKKQSKLNYQTADNSSGSIEIAGGALSVDNNKVIILLDEPVKK